MTVPFEFGMFLEFVRRHEHQSESAAFDEGFDLIDAAEAWGLDAVWLAELHFAGDRSVLAAPMTLAAVIAGRTRRIKIGPAVQLLPLADPIHMAEDAATVDQASRGRLIFGVGRSGFTRAYEGFGLDYAESRDRFAEALTVIRRAWTEPECSFDGQYYHYRQVKVSPKPYQQPFPPIRVAASSHDTFVTLGEQGYPLLVSVRTGTFRTMMPDIEAYHESWRAAGHPSDGEVYLRLPVYVADTREQALAEPEASMMTYFRSFGNRLETSVVERGVSTSDARAQRGQWLQQASYEDVLREKVVVGTPDMVTERLKEIQAELGLNGILVELNCGSEIPHDKLRRSLQLLCDEVMPGFKQ